MSEQVDTVLVTGSNGFIGAKVVERLLQRGRERVRCLVRTESRLDRLQAATASAAPDQVQVITGDLTNPADCARAVASVSVVYHLAASFEKSFEHVSAHSIAATRNLLEAFNAYGQPRRFVFASSFAVYANDRLPRGAFLDENSPIEDASPGHVDPYTFGKLRQEALIREFGAAHGIPFVILRPGTVFGPGKRDLTGRVGRRVSKLFVHVSGGNELPLTYVDNCADAIALAGVHPGIDGETFNVVDDDRLTSGEFLDAYRSRATRMTCISIPYGAAWAFSAAYEGASKVLPFLPKQFNRRRCAAEWKGNRFSNRKLRDRLGWEPRVPMRDAMARYLEQFPANGSAR
jgi:nucleoside-diphosphate-sugar epimerase